MSLVRRIFDNHSKDGNTQPYNGRNYHDGYMLRTGPNKKVFVTPVLQ